MLNGKDIQVEDGGYVRIHAAILEALARVRLSGAEFRCVMFLLRKTYGWNKKEDQISLTQWEIGTNTKRPQVKIALSKLIEKNIIYRDTESAIVTYGFNKYIENWTCFDVDSDRGKRFEKQEVVPNQIPSTCIDTSTYLDTSTSTCIDTDTSIYLDTHNRQLKTIKDISENKKMFSLLVEICRVDGKLKRGQLNKTIKNLLEAGYTVEDLDTLRGWWYANDFRGQKGQPPTLAQVVDKILQAKQESAPPPPRKTEKVQIILPGGEISEAKR
jgi:phage replication O-like protein O